MVRRSNFATNNGRFAAVLSCLGAAALLLVCVAVVTSAVRRASHNNTSTDFVLHSQANHIAKVGLAEASRWLRRQAAQPVSAFAPTAQDSSEPSIGLVREFAITGDVWGRFEVRRSAGAPVEDNTEGNANDNPDSEWPGSTDPMVSRPTPIDRPDARLDPLAAEDLSKSRGYAHTGRVWRLRCVATVYRRVSVEHRFDQHPNQILHDEVLESEVTRLGLRLPGRAALCARNGGQVTIRAGGRVTGGSSAVGIYHLAESDHPQIDEGEVRGCQAVASARRAKLYEDSPRSVFGVHEAELFAMADDWIDDPARVPTEFGSDTIHCVKVEELGFTADRPLRGGGILYLRGNMTINAGSDAAFRGLIYVDGDLTVNSAAMLRGAVIVTGKVLLQGTGGWSTIEYDDAVMSNLVDAVGAYRTSRRPRRIEWTRTPADTDVSVPATPNGTGPK